MKAVGIICEYNPFHDGHKYLIDNVRSELNPDAVVCLMSGNFVQRGQASLWDKYTRANWAIKGGADLVLELPTKYAVNSAQRFAQGGVNILNRMGCLTYMAFGSECGDIDILKKASFLENSEFSGKIKEYLKEGYSYASAYSKASGIEVFDTPNNILSVEYLRALKSENSLIKPYTIKRTNAMSASDIREGIITGKSISNTYVNPINFDEYEERLFAILRSKLITMQPEELAEISEISEGLENKILKEISKSSSYQDFIYIVKSKRYTYAKISRIFLKIVLGITKEDEETPIEGVKILALNDIGTNILKIAKTTSDLKFAADIKDSYANDMYSILTGVEIYANSDYVCNSKPTKI